MTVQPGTVIALLARRVELLETRVDCHQQHRRRTRRKAGVSPGASRTSYAKQKHLESCWTLLECWLRHYQRRRRQHPQDTISATTTTTAAATADAYPTRAAAGQQASSSTRSEKASDNDDDDVESFVDPMVSRAWWFRSSILAFAGTPVRAFWSW